MARFRSCPTWLNRGFSTNVWPTGPKPSPTTRRSTYLDRTWTWAQWNDRVRRLAGALTGFGVKRGDVVAFLDKNHPACLEMTFAAASLGAANAIINFRLAADEMDYVLNDSGAKVLIVGAELKPIDRQDPRQAAERRARHRGHPGGWRRRRVRGAAGGGDAGGPLADVEPDDVCIIMYSSGTTGRPKGVALTQANLIAHTVNGARGIRVRRRRQEHGVDAAVPRRRHVRTRSSAFTMASRV